MCLILKYVVIQFSFHNLVEFTRANNLLWVVRRWFLYELQDVYISDVSHNWACI